ncbi:hypothetical protein D3C85_1454560 [compost metagenome]
MPLLRIKVIAAQGRRCQLILLCLLHDRFIIHAINRHRQMHSTFSGQHPVLNGEFGCNRFAKLSVTLAIQSTHRRKMSRVMPLFDKQRQRALFGTVPAAQQRTYSGLDGVC